VVERKRGGRRRGIRGEEREGEEEGGGGGRKRGGGRWNEGALGGCCSWLENLRIDLGVLVTVEEIIGHSIGEGIRK